MGKKRKGHGLAEIARQAYLRPCGATVDEAALAIIEKHPNTPLSKAQDRASKIWTEIYHNRERYEVTVTGRRMTATIKNPSAKMSPYKSKSKRRNVKIKVGDTVKPGKPGTKLPDAPKHVKAEWFDLGSNRWSDTNHFRAAQGLTLRDKELKHCCSAKQEEHIYLAAVGEFFRPHGASIADARAAVQNAAGQVGVDVGFNQALEIAQKSLTYLRNYAGPTFTVRKMGAKPNRYPTWKAEYFGEGVKDTSLWDAESEDEDSESESEIIVAPVEPYPEVTVEAEPGGERQGFILPDWYPYFLDAVERDEVVLVVGPTGCGKSTMCQIAAEDIELVFERFNFNGETTTDNCIGFTTIKDGATVFKPGIIPQSMQNGELLLLDEVDAATPEVLFFMHRLLEKQDGHPREIILPDAPEGEERLEADVDFRIVAAANTLGRGDDAALYQGTNILNEAFLNRFGKIFHMDYPPNEEAILVKHCDQRYADALAEFARSLRVTAKDKEWPVVISTRDLLSIAKVADSWGLEPAIRMSWLNRLSEANQKEVTDAREWGHMMAEVA